MNYGVLLVVMLRKKGWAGGLDTAGVLKELREFVKTFAVSRGEVIAVECIDFVKARKRT